MIKYSWKDIIVNPYSEEAKNCIGKECYFATIPYQCLKRANNNKFPFLEILKEIKPKKDYPFISNTLIMGVCIIPKKEEEKIKQKIKAKET